MANNIDKLENQGRVKELAIEASLDLLDVGDEMVVCDYGTGTGLFALPVSSRTNQTVYALDKDEAMLAVVDEKAKGSDIRNIKTLQVDADAMPLENNSVDRLILVTVLHEIEDVPDFAAEVSRVIKDDGKVMVIDFFKKDTPMGPPASKRISAYQAARHFLREGIDLERQVELGENMYLLLLKKS